jgi:cytidyltransferase-like protein
MHQTTYQIFGGRFQPFHNGHLSLLRRTVEKYGGPVVIGIVKPDPTTVFPGDEKRWIRFDRKDNVLNYWERFTCIRLTMQEDAKLRRSVEAIVPLPRPSVNLGRAKQFIPPKPRAFILFQKRGDEVEEYKRKTYIQLGEQVHVIKDSDVPGDVTLVDGTLIRCLIALGVSAWKAIVPEPTIDYLERIGFPQRVTESLNATEAMTIIASGWEHGLKGSQLGKEILEQIEAKRGRRHGAEAETSHRTSTAQAVAKLLGGVPVDSAGEVRCMINEECRQCLVEVVATLLSANGKLVVPQYYSVVAGRFEVVMNSDARALILAELGRRP